MRIVSLSPSTTEILYALGAADQLIGVTAFCDYPSEAKQKPRVGGWSTVTDEKVLALRPDLVLTSTIVQGQSQKRYKNARFAVHHFDPRSLENIYENIMEIGKLVGKQKEASQLVVDMQHIVSSLTGPPVGGQDRGSSEGQVLDSRLRGNDRKQSAVSRKRVYCEEWPKPPMISGNWVPELVGLASGEYGILRKGEVSRAVTTEEVSDFDPEIIILNYCGFGTRADVSAIKKRPGWEQISAVKNNRVYVIDDSLLNRPGPRIVEGLHQLNKIIP